MPFVVRDAAGKIAEVHKAGNSRAREELAPENPELRRFLAEASGTQVLDALDESDRGLIRVLEDLIALLIDKRIIALTDLPEAAQQKLSYRYSLRSELADLKGIVGEPDELLLP